MNSELTAAAILTSDLDIYRTASVLIREHGDEADLAHSVSRECKGYWQRTMSARI